MAKCNLPNEEPFIDTLNNYLVSVPLHDMDLQQTTFDRSLEGNMMLELRYAKRRKYPESSGIWLRFTGTRLLFSMPTGKH